jgi:mRNA-degrading endonuclease YafQ of YafQ-DinJ toxin-antitoxin module
MVTLCIHEVAGCLKDYRDASEAFDCTFIFEREHRKPSLPCIERLI